MTAKPSSENPIAAASTQDVRGSGLSVASGSPLLKAWAEACGIDENDERVIYGWPDKFRHFRQGWEAAMKQSIPLEDMRAMQVALAQEKDDKIDALRTELAETRMACEDWIKIANAEANKSADAISIRDTTMAALRRESERLNWLNDWGYEYDGLLERGWGIGLPQNQKGNTRDIRAAIDAQMELNFDRRFVLANVRHEPRPTE